MNKKNTRMLATLLAVVLLIISAVPAMADAVSDVIFSFDTEKPTTSSYYTGLTLSYDTSGANGNSDISMKMTPQIGYGLDQMNYTMAFAAGAFKSDGVVLWAKSERYSATMAFILMMSWRDSSNVKHESTYSTTFTVTNNGRNIVIPFSSLSRSAGEDCDVVSQAKVSYTNVVIRYFNRPDDSILSPVWFDTFRQKNDTDVATPPVYGEPNAPLPTDPDSLYTPSQESAAGTTIYDFGTIPSGMSNPGFTRVENTNPANAEAGKSLKLIPQYGYSTSEMSLNIGVPQGKTTGSGISFWAKADRNVSVNVIFQLSSAADRTIKGDYSTPITITTTMEKHEISFGELTRVSGNELNPSTAARANFYRIIIKFIKNSVTTIYVDTLQNMAYDENLEATDPIITQSSSSARPADQEELLSHEYNWDLNSNWKLDWMDDFNGTQINPNNWTYDYGLRNGAESGYFTDKEENVRVENGQLVIETLKKNYPDDLSPIAPYTSAEVVTRFRKTFLYGRLEIYAKLPAGKGMWPAFWTVGQGVAWPKGGEIDILEMIGGQWNNHEGSRGTDLAHFTLHWAKDGTGGHQAEGQSIVLPDGKDFTTAYHTIGMIWSPKEIQFYIDDDILHSIDITSSERYDGFHLPHYAMINTSVGSTEGAWASTPDDSTWLNRQLYQVDYIKYYTYNGDGYNPTPDTGSTQTTTQSTVAPTGETTTTSSVATTTSTSSNTSTATTVATTTVVTTTAAVNPTITEQTGYSVTTNGTDRLVRGFTLGDTAGSVTATTPGVSVEFYKGETKVSDTDKIATGMTMKIMYNGNLTDSAQVVVYGDVNGDGNVNASDLLNVKRYLLSVSSLEGCYLEAAKLNKNASVAASDLLKMKRVLLGLDTIVQ